MLTDFETNPLLGYKNAVKKTYNQLFFLLEHQNQ